MGVDIGPKIGIDGEAEFRKQINQLTQQIKTFGSELGVAASEMDSNKKSAEGLTKQNTILNKSISVQEQKLDELKRGLQEAADKFGENDAKTLKWQQAVNNATIELNKMKNQVSDNNDALLRFGQEEEEAGEKAVRFGDILKANLASEVVVKGIETITGAIKNLAANLKEYSQESEQSVKKATAYFGETGAAAEQTERAIHEVFTAGVGDSMDDVANAVITVKKNLEDLSDTDLQNLTQQAMTLDDLYGIDMNETLRGVNSLMTQFGIDAQTAMDYIVSGTQNGLDKTNELGDNLAEYSGKFAQAGYSAEEYFQLLQNGLEGGAYNLDKVNDAINEVTTRLTDGTIEDALSNYSSETQQVFESWKNGGATQKQVIDSIVKDIRNTTNQQDALNRAATAFGTMAEDGNLKFIESLDSVGNAYSDVTGKASELFNATTTSQQAFDSALRNAQEQLSPLGDELNSLGAEIIPAIAEKIAELASEADWGVVSETISGMVQKALELGDYLISNGDAVISVIGGIAAGFVAWNVISVIDGVVKAIQAFKLANEWATAAQWLMNAALTANPIGIVITLIAGIVAALATFIATNDEAKQKVVEAWEGIKTAIGAAIDAVVQTWENLKTKALEIGESIQNGFSKGVEYVKELPGKFLEWGSQMVSNVTDTITNTDWLSVGGDILIGLANGILGTVGRVVDAAKEAAGKIKNAFVDFFDIHSPSKLMKNAVGKMIPAGIADGIILGTGDAVKSAKQASKDIFNAFNQQHSMNEPYDIPHYSNGTAAAYDRLAEQLGNMQIVLSDKTLVGKLTPQIDTTLGGYTKVRGRYYT